MTDENAEDDNAKVDDDTNINLADYQTEDGDFDAAKILASIGPRPKRRKRKAPDSFDGGSYPDGGSATEGIDENS